MVENNVFLIGRLTATPELKKTNNDLSVISFTVAVNKPFNKENDHPEANFIDCVAWRKTAEFIAKYFGKGSRIALRGGLQTRMYDDKEGKKRKVVEVVVEEVTFIDKKADAPAPKNVETTICTKGEVVDNDTDAEDNELPF